MVSRFGERMLRGEDRYLRDVETVAAGRRPASDFYSERAVRAFISRRLRAVSWAKAAFEMEQRQLGERFSPDTLEVREFSYIIIGEVAALLARWTGGPQSDALAIASCAVRAAHLLWLEDDDRAMILARTVVEQAARLRAWRLKPQKAKLLEEQGSRTSTRDWLEAAGWRRLSILNRSLGEFAHVTPESRWTGAREVLAAIQDRDPELGAAPIQTARGSTLNAVVFSFGAELSYLIREHHSPVAKAFESVLPYADESKSAARIEEWLQRCWNNRSLSLGMSDISTAN
jgi:hypothetical protein